MSAEEATVSEEAAEVLGREEENLRHLADTRYDLAVELGRTEMPLSRVRDLRKEDVIEVSKLAGEAFEIRVNEHAFAEGEIVVVSDMVSIRVTRLVDAHGLPPLPEGKSPRGTSTPGPEPQAEEVSIGATTRIAEGSFEMGSDQDDAPANQRPLHSVYLLPYLIDRFPVTNQDYREFIEATGHRAPIHWQRGAYSIGTSRHPVVNVSWEDAVAYADWAGKRLPTEAEWEKAARGTDQRLYPWGNRFVDGERCNNANVVGTTLPVDEFPLGRSPYGIWDMAGNVCEWCSDYYDQAYYRYSPDVVPIGPEGGRERVIRGGHYSENRPGVRTTHRASAPQTACRENIGFRCVSDV